MFYLKPPRGNIELERLFDLARRRLDFILNNQHDLYEESNDTKKYNDTEECDFSKKCGFKKDNNEEACILGSNRDRVSHFALAILANIYAKQNNNRDVLRNLHRLERRLLLHRLCRISKPNLLRQVRQFRRHLQELLLNQPSLNLDMMKIIEFLSNFIEDDKKGAKLPFYMVPSMVSDRQAILQEGQALILGTEQFKAALSEIMDQFAQNQTKALSDLRVDERLIDLANQIGKMLDTSPKSPSKPKNALKLNVIESSLEKFPPCMLKLHRQLNLHRRLPHHSRIALTLFLKDVGLDVEENIEFWSNFYDLEAVRSANISDSSCFSRTWQKDSRRYIYSIRHLYGLEGSRRASKCPSCSSILRQQRTSASPSVPSCPFDHIDNHLSDNHVIGHVTDDVIELVRLGKPQEACGAYLKMRTNSDLKDLVTPIQYYNAFFD